MNAQAPILVATDFSAPARTPQTAPHAWRARARRR